MNELQNPPALVSVVLCALDAESTIGEQMESLARQTYQHPWELIVVDDGCTDRTTEIVRTFHDVVNTRIVASPNPRRKARALNVGCRAAAGELLVFCDADDVADPGWLAAMVRAAHGCGAVGGHLEEEILNDPGIRAWRPALTDGDLPGAFDKVKVPVGANCAVWKSTYEQVGGFDETMKFFSEEVDFFWRVAVAGNEIRYAPDAIIHYRHRTSTKALRRQAFAYGRGNIILYQKFRHLGLPPTGTGDTLKYAWMVTKGIPAALRDKRRRGAWMRFTWYLSGQATESFRQHVWHLG